MNSELPPNERPPQSNTSFSMSPTAIGGAILILIGGFFLLQTLNILPGFEFNWWALFILFPVFAFAKSAWDTYQANGERWNSESRSKLVGAGVLTVVFMTLMFDWDWGKIWPLFLILGGLGVLFGGIGKHSE